MAKDKQQNDAEFQDQGSLDAPQAPTGPVNPVLGDLDESQVAVNATGRMPHEADPTVDAVSAGTGLLTQVNEAREAGHPLNEKDDSRPEDEQPSGDPVDLGVADAPDAGSVDY